MELIQISENALKVSLTREDMEFYDIEFEMLDYENTQTRRAIWNILDEAKKSLGFEAAREGLYIQAYRSKCGGCELFVRLTAAQKERKERLSLFEFDTMDALLLGCDMLSHCGYSDESTAYVGDNRKFYLELKSEPLAIFDIAKTKKHNKEYLSEHAKLICHSAVTTLANLR